jgi:hypothetical protein
MQETVCFVLCIEDNPIREQALLLVESIRTFAGRHKDAEIIAISARGNGVDSATQRQLARSKVRYVDLPLNLLCPEYGSANRIYGAAWAASNTDASTLIVVDSDTLFFDEPELLGADFDVAARPVDMRHTTSTGPQDPIEGYLAALCAEAGATVDVLPFIQTTIDQVHVRAAYNGGYVVVRRESRVLERAAELFTRSIALDLRPRKDLTSQVFASTGWVGLKASEYWGSNQAATAIAIWSTGQRMKELDARYNVPLHLLVEQERPAAEWRQAAPVHVHYHWLLTPNHQPRALELLAALGAQNDRLDWVAERTPLNGVGRTN